MAVKTGGFIIVNMVITCLKMWPLKAGDPTMQALMYPILSSYSFSSI